jgi:hypothetical protein
MGFWSRQQPTKLQSAFVAVLGLLMLFNAAYAVLAEGRTVTPLLIAVVILDLVWIVAAVWLCRRTAKNPRAQG